MQQRHLTFDWWKAEPLFKWGSGVWVEGNQISLKDQTNIYDNSPLLSYFTDGCYSIICWLEKKNRNISYANFFYAIVAQF